MPVKNIAHDNAREAFKKIEDVKRCDVKIQKKYLSLVHGADTFVHQCGLLQTLAFYLSKDEKHHQLLTDQLLEFIGSEYLPDGNRMQGYKRLIGKEDSQLMTDTARIRKYLLWLKRYAEAMLDEEKQNNRGGENEENRNSRQPESQAS
ncbi:type III-B CRISPR module-associated protein Cmr5 [Candidatus Electronema sp. JC]|uniref:type III-B CRISPR module-associated protein Cmr5 n=1 Tax=Candidatus Electronema sp. JC TaxID=3401570 RepID=UPI003B43AAE0